MAKIENEIRIFIFDYLLVRSQYYYQAICDNQDEYNEFSNPFSNEYSIEIIIIINLLEYC